MKPRVLFAFYLGALLMVACSALATQEPVVSQPVNENPAQATEPTIPGAAPVVTEALPVLTEEASMSFKLTSTAFAQGEPIPVMYSCDGEDISPPLAWGDPPQGTQSLALIMDDPDAPIGTWDHWLVFNIPAKVRELPENMPTGMKFGDVAATFGKNSWKRNDYGGPCPPGGTHRYFFKLYALDNTLPSDESTNKKQLLKAMDGHILAEAELMGTFSR